VAGLNATQDQGAPSTPYDDARDAVWDQVLAHLSEMSPYMFQGLTAALVEAMGYDVLWTAPSGSQTGVNIKAHTDPTGEEGSALMAQTDHRTSDKKVGVAEIRRFVSGLDDGDIGIYVTNTSFTPPALKEARTHSKHQVTLVDAEGLFDLWTRFYKELRYPDRAFLPLEPVFYLMP